MSIDRSVPLSSSVNFIRRFANGAAIEAFKSKWAIDKASAVNNWIGVIFYADIEGAPNQIALVLRHASTGRECATVADRDLVESLVQDDGAGESPFIAAAALMDGAGIGFDQLPSSKG